MSQDTQWIIAYAACMAVAVLACMAISALPVLARRLPERAPFLLCLALLTFSGFLGAGASLAAQSWLRYAAMLLCANTALVLWAGIWGRLLHPVAWQKNRPSAMSLAFPVFFCAIFLLVFSLLGLFGAVISVVWNIVSGAFFAVLSIFS